MTLPTQYLYRLCIEPTASEPDDHRREFILNTLLSGLLLLGMLAFLASMIDALLAGMNLLAGGSWQIIVFIAIVGGLLFTSRRGHSERASLIFIGFLMISSIDFVSTWGVRLAEAELLIALTIVIAGVLFRAPLALVAAGTGAAGLLVITYLQVNGLMRPQSDWQGEPVILMDAVGYIAVFATIGIVSWLSNRETDRSLQRARRSEVDLQKERDSLEIKVIERTQELEEMQVAKLLEMQPFAEFGRIGSSLVHDIANPLTAVRLNLEELGRQQQSDAILLAQRDLQLLERYLQAARKQIKRESNVTTFSVGSELRQIAHLLMHRARQADVRLVVVPVTNLKIRGDAVKFGQLTANLIANAIDASTAIKSAADRQVTVHVKRAGEAVVIAVHDHGAGISADQINHLFEPFYSTKRALRSGLGLGLASVKQYVETDFRGSISVTSNKQDGTTFSVTLRSRPQHER